ncbi:MAG: hypothetical protein E7056_03425 [Lentisphaerae bacterium]|nr:hypothetical protein [Lentisphaerota bacterium]
MQNREYRQTVFLVDMPDGSNQILNTFELCRAFLRREVHCSTLIADPDKKDFHRLDEESLLQDSLASFYRTVDCNTSLWTVWGILPVNMAILIVGGWLLGVNLDWRIGLTAICFYCYWYWDILSSLLIFRDPKTSLQWCGTLPLLRDYYYFKLYKAFVNTLPAGRRRWAEFFILTILLGDGAFFVGTIYFMFANYGGTAVWISWCISFAGMIGFYFSTFPERVKLRREWKQLNPRPAAWGKWFRLSRQKTPPPKLFQAYNRYVLSKKCGKYVFLQSLDITLKCLVLFLLPLAVTITTAWAGGCWQLSRIDEPLQLVALDVPQLEKLPKIPDAAVKYLGFAPCREKVEEEYIAALKGLKNSLINYRSCLRKMAALYNCKSSDIIRYSPLESEDYPDYRSYIRWRQLEMNAADKINRNKLVKELYSDLAALTDLQLSGQRRDVVMFYYASAMRGALLRDNTADFSDAELQQELLFYKKVMPITLRNNFLRGLNWQFEDFIGFLENKAWIKFLTPGFKADFLRNLSVYDAVADGRQPYENDKKLLLQQSAFSCYIYELEQLARCRLMQDYIELELYYRKNRSYPENPTMQRDPFSGNPLRYKPNQTIYSVGADGSDDNGDISGDDSRDIGFTLPEHKGLGK